MNEFLEIHVRVCVDDVRKYRFNANVGQTLLLLVGNFSSSW